MMPRPAATAIETRYINECSVVECLNIPRTPRMTKKMTMNMVGQV